MTIKTTIARILLKRFKQRAIDFNDLLWFYWNALTKKYQLLTKMLNLLHQERRSFETQLFINNWRFLNSKTLRSRKSSRSQRFNSKQQRSQQKQKKNDRNEQSRWEENKDKYRSFEIVNNYYLHCCCKKHYSKFISFSSLASFESLLNLFVVALTFCCQTIFIKIMIISESNSLKISSFIESLKMTISIFFFLIATSFAVKYMIFMLVLKSLKTLHFNKHNIIEFLKHFEKLCDEYKVFVKKWWIKFFRYCKRSIIEFIKTSISYVNRNWVAFNKKMRKKYKNKNAKQITNSRLFLKKYKNKTHIDD